MVPDQRHSNGLFVHVERDGAISLAPNAVMSGIPPLVGGKYDERIVAQAELFQAPHNPAHVMIHTAHQRGVRSLGFAAAVKRFEIPPALRIFADLRQAWE